MRRLRPRLLPLLLLAGLAVSAQENPAPKPLPPLHTPDLATWKLEVTPDLGGWVTAGPQEIRIKLVDPKDPDPPKDDEVQFDDYGYEDEGEYVEPPEKSAEELRQERLWEEEAAKRTAWRDRRLLLWFNGATAQLPVRVGHTAYHSFISQNGENRLELWEPDSGKRLVRSWWTSASRTRPIHMPPGMSGRSQGARPPRRSRSAAAVAARPVPMAEVAVMARMASGNMRFTWARPVAAPGCRRAGRRWQRQGTRSAPSRAARACGTRRAGRRSAGW